MNTEPSLSRVTRFALPVVAGTLLVTGSQFAVVAVLGHLPGPALYIRSVYAPISFLIISLTTGLSVAAQVGSARRRGAGDVAAVACLGAIARVGVTACLGLGVLLLALASPVSRLLSVPSDQRGLFFRFVAAMALVAPLGLVAELTTGVVRGVGFPGVASLLTATSVVLLVAGVAVMGVAAGVGLWAVPISSAVAGSVELVVGLLVLDRCGMLRWAALRAWDPDSWLLVRRVGIPVGVSYVLLFLFNLLQLLIVKPYGPSAVAGFTLGYTLQSFVIVPAIGFGSAVAVLVNQHSAGGEQGRARLALRNGSVVVVCAYIAITVLLVSTGDGLVSHLSEDAAVVREANSFMNTVGPTFGFTALALYLLTLLEHTGRGVVAMMANVFFFSVLIGIGALLTAQWHSTDGLYRAMAVGAALGVLGGAPIAGVLLFRRPLPLAVAS